MSLVLIVISALSIAYCSRAQAAESPQGKGPSVVGIIEEIRGVAYIRSGLVGQAVRLNPSRDAWRALNDTDYLRCDPGGNIKIFVIGGHRQTIRPSLRWKSIFSKGSAKSEMDEAVANYGRIGGRERLIESTVYEPSPASTVRADWLVFRWKPVPNWEQLILTIEDAYGKEIWSQLKINGSVGVLDSQSARDTLQKYKDSQQRFSLVIRNKHENQIRINFFLLSGKQEQALNHDLAHLKAAKVPGLRHIVRANIFDRYGLCNEASAEYEEAIKLAPQSRDLLGAAIQIEQCTGNLDRIRELQQMRRTSAAVSD